MPLDRLLSNLLSEAAEGRAHPADTAALFGVDESVLRRVAQSAYPLSLPDDALKLLSMELLAIVEHERQGGTVRDAIAKLAGKGYERHPVRQVLAAMP